MKRTHTQQPIIPIGWTGKSFNTWRKFIQRQLDKINGTDIAARM